MSVKVISGLNECIAAFRLANAETARRVVGAVHETTHEIREDAARRVPVSGPNSRKAKGRPGPGELRDTIREEYSKEGFTGFVKVGYGKLLRGSRANTSETRAGYLRRQKKLRAKARARSLTSRGLGNYAMVVEYGSPRQGKAAEPFLRPARQAAIPRHEARLRDAVQGAVKAAGGDA